MIVLGKYWAGTVVDWLIKILQPRGYVGLKIYFILRASTAPQHIDVLLEHSLPFETPSIMAPYVSDSSGGEEDDFTETNVLLGYASKEVGDDTISYLGGRPVGWKLLGETADLK